MKYLQYASKFASILALIICAQLGATTVQARTTSEDAVESSYTEAKVVEVSATRIAVIAKSGVEHVIAIDGKKTKVYREGQAVMAEEIKEGDIVTVDLDLDNPIKVARSIEMASSLGNQLAKNRR